MKAITIKYGAMCNALMCALWAQACSETRGACRDDMGNQVLCYDERDMGNEPDSESSDMSPDADMSPPDEGSDEGGQEADMLCVPESQEILCAQACGVQTNVCGQAVNCAPCICDDAEVSKTRCGMCELGVLRCDDPQRSNDTSCQYDVEDVFESTTCEQVLYVDASSQGGDGSSTNPFTSYKAALARFTEGATGVIVLSEGTYPEELIVQEGVHVVGGYERLPAGWLQKEEARVEFTPPQKPGEPVFGLRARDITQRTVIHAIVVQAPDATSEQTSYGAYLVDASGVVLSAMTILAGRGGDGTAGQPGQKGADGGDGGSPFCDYDLFRYQDESEHPAGGEKGKNVSCPEADGGRGGHGAENDQGGVIPARDGSPSADGMSEGGSAGKSARSTGNEGGNGRSAMASQVTGMPGMAGESTGSLESGLWVTAGNGQKADDGNHGSGGGGGGGAGTQDGTWMMGGGGGGAGGCGGEGGVGGMGGGGSFGLMASRSNATLIDSKLSARAGGEGGAGGIGGSGGEGGNGKPGTYRTCNNVTEIWKSGDGGHGAKGSQGGQGGGGAGGVSYGSYCEVSTLSITSSTLQAGASAAGGEGGTRGKSGLVENQRQCY